MERSGIPASALIRSKGGIRIQATMLKKQEPGMNKLEAAYGSYLDLQKVGGAVLDFQFEKLKLRLADNTFYTPDYYVIKSDLTMEFHEVKGFWEDDARVKIKVAAKLFPFKFIAVTQDKRSKLWMFEEFN